MKHPLDRRQASGTARLPAFCAVERSGTSGESHPTVQAAVRRPRRSGSSTARLVQFLRIARGDRA